MTRLTHLDENGAAKMVDVSAKLATERSATAEGRIVMSHDALQALSSGENPKGDAVAAARIAGIMAAKRTGELIPLCHPLGLDSMLVEFEIEEQAIRVRATAKLVGKTGIEMEALTAVSVALLTLYDMGKAIDKEMRIEGLRLLEKSGGKSGHWRVQD